MLDEAQLNAIAQEARMCFLYEDAPEYQAQLEEGLSALERGDQGAVSYLMKTAHALKGGAGVSQLVELSALAHQ